MLTKINNPLNDPFYKAKINPLFHAAFSQYWDFLEQASFTEEQVAQAQQTQINLLRFVFRHLFKSLYLTHSPQVKGSVYFLTCISADGMGDYFALLKSAKTLKMHHPQLDVHAIYTYLLPLPEINPQSYHLNRENIQAFYQPTDVSTHVLEKILDGQKIVPTDVTRESVNQSEALYKNLQESLAVVNIALAMNTFDNPVLSAKSFYFSESGYFPGIGNYLVKNWFSMGLEPFEEGIFLKPNSVDGSWHNPHLPEYLWKNQKSNYSSTHHLYVGYLPKIPAQQLEFIYFLALLNKQETAVLDIILPKSFDPRGLDLSKLADFNISRIEVMHLDVDKKEELKTNNASGKFMRLVCALPLDPEDFSKLLYLSRDVVGCTGDLSLGECLSLGKLPYYELRPHKLGEIEAFRQTAQVLNLPDVSDYFGAFSEAEKLYAIFTRDSFHGQWKTFHKFIKDHYCFENSMIAHLNRYFWQLIKPSVKEKEEEVIQNYAKGLLDGKEAYVQLEKELT